MKTTWELLAEQAYKINQDRKRLEEEYQVVLNALLDLSNNEGYEGGQYKLGKFVRKGYIDYNAIPELRSIELDHYRKSDVIYWKIERLNYV